jgi:HAE1 family hydrophobic/amphiphilic exporter-1
MVIPPLCYLFGRKGAVDDKEVKGPEAQTAWYHRIYVPALRWALTHRALTIVGALVLTGGSLSLVPFIGTSFISTGGEAQLTVSIEMPRGASTEATLAKASEVEDVIRQSLETQVFQTTIGQSSGFLGALSAFAGGSASNSASITVVLDEGANIEEEAVRLRGLLQPVAGEATITVADPNEQQAQASGLDSSSLAVTVKGEDPDVTVQAANDIQAQLELLDGIANIESDAAEVLPQPQIDIDPAALAAAGLDPQVIQQELMLLLMGGTIGQASVNGQAYDLLIAPVLPNLTDQAQLLDLKVGTQGAVSLGEIADVSFAPKPIYIRHVDQEKAITVSGTITAKDVGAVNRDVQSILDSTSLPAGVSATMGGVSEEMAESFRQMGIAIIIAVGISYLVMVLTLRSFLNPFIIMFSLPLASVGALLGLFFTGRPLDISGMMGSLMLVGIVLTNAIVLITLVEQLRRSGRSTFDALMEGGRLRLRPILMTALTTMIALVPVAIGFGEGALVAAGLATVVIGGLFTSTVLTLVVIPVIYSLFDGLRQRMGRRRGAG